MKTIGIDLGGTNIAVGVVDENGQILAKISVPTEAQQRSADEIIAAMADTVQRLLLQSGISWEEIASVGIGSPGSVDRENGIVISACNLNFSDTHLAEKMQALLGKPVYVENDANCAAWAEAMAGAAAGTRHSLTVTLGTGVGGGIVINGHLYGGFNNFGGEFGHFIITEDGEPCACGRKGCLEAYASATALARDARRAAEKNPASLLNECAKKEGKFSGRTAFDAAKLGDADAKAVVDSYIRHLALGLFNLVKIFQPEVIVVGGGVANEGDALFVPLREAVTANAYSARVPEHKRTKLLPAKLGGDAGIVGAALLGSDE